jgi:signal transduction histidine kinase
LRRYRALAAVLLCFVGLSLLVTQLDGTPSAVAPQPAGGRVDLAQWDFKRSGSATLAGEWRYFDKRWAHEVVPSSHAVAAQVPGPWPASAGPSGNPRTEGYGTYVLNLTLPVMPQGERFAIDTGYVLSAYRVYANGALIVTSGTPAASREGESARAYSKIARLPAAREVELRLELSNHLNRYGGTFLAPVVGLESDIVAHRDLLVALSMLLVGAMLFAACYHFVAFALSPDSKITLWFASFAALLGLRTLLIEPLASFAVPAIGQDWVWRVDYAASILLLPAAYWFFVLSFPRQVAERHASWITGFCLGAAVTTLVGGPAIGEFAMKVYEVLGAGVIVYLAQAIGRAAWNEESGAHLALAGWSLSTVAVVHDILLDNGFVVVTGINLIPFGFLAFFLCLSGTLVKRFRDAYRRTQELSRETKALNERLEAAVDERTRELSDKVELLKHNQLELERARAEAISANVAKSRFLATMSHELRTPLNSILGFSEIIRDETLGSIGDARYSEYASDIHRGGTHLLALISDILDLSRIEAGRVELKREPLDVSEIARDARHHAATRERKATDAVTMRFEPHLPLVDADRRCVLQMIVNLLSNALKFTEPGSSIVLSVFRRGDGGVSIEVADTGVGMKPEDIPKALAVFSQVDDGHARRHEGTGLGLPIVKSLIELHGGTLSLTSEKGRGTTVRLDFPAAVGTPAALSDRPATDGLAVAAA